VGLDGVQLVWRVEESFGITITDAEAATSRTVGALNTLIAEKVAANASAGGRVVRPEPSITWDLLVPIVVEELGVPPARVTPDAEWIRDLGV